MSHAISQLDDRHPDPPQSVFPGSDHPHPWQPLRPVPRLNSPQAMDQAQIAREIARGNGFTTKMIRPVAYYQAEKPRNARSRSKASGHLPLAAQPAAQRRRAQTHRRGRPGRLADGENEMVFPLDRVIATVATLFFLMAIGVNYLLISRIFDAKIAGVCAILMLFCETFWNYSLSGLPQMLMLLLFSCGLYFVYRAVEAATEGRIAMTPAVIAGVFFTLLALTHWMTVWIALGYIIFAAIAFRPRGIVGISVLALLMHPAIFVMLRNRASPARPSAPRSSPLQRPRRRLGDRRHAHHRPRGRAAVLDGLIGKSCAPPCSKPPTSSPSSAASSWRRCFSSRCCIRSSALDRQLPLGHPADVGGGRLGLAFFGISTDALDPEPDPPAVRADHDGLRARLHLDPLEPPRIRRLHAHAAQRPPHGHRRHLRAAAGARAAAESPRRHAPARPRRRPALAALLRPGPQQQDSGLKGWVTDETDRFSDQPWAVAWYADRVSIWLPPTRTASASWKPSPPDLQTPVAPAS
jgi:hypothetical protein